MGSPLAAVVFSVGGGVRLEAEFAHYYRVLDGGVFNELGDFTDVGEYGGAGEIGKGWEGVVLVGVDDEGGGCCRWS